LGTRSPRRGAVRGLTLIEIVVVMGVLVLMIGIAVSSLSNLSSTQLRTQTNRLAAALRHTYSRSVSHGLYMRMVLDIDSDSYWVEASPEPMFLAKRKRQEGEPEGFDEKLDDDDPASQAKRSSRPKFTEDEVIPKITMERGIGLAGVMSTGQDGVFESGKAYIHFFPNGFAEPTLIYVTDGDESFLTLELSPLTGKVTRKVGKVDPDRDFGRPDDEEDEGR
jgi:general secretion pathway protein H